MKRSHVLPTLAALLLAGTASATRAQDTKAADIPVVYHVSEVASMRDALNNITNHLAVNPGAHITLLANARGVYGLVSGERDRQGDYLATIGGLQAKGVKFVACGMSMKKNNIVESSLLPDVATVPSGVVELTRLQAAERHAYIKP